MQPKHLAAICTWEGAADFYRDMAHHGGIFCNGFARDWSQGQVFAVQNGRGTRGFLSSMTGGWVSGPETLTDEELGANRHDFGSECLAAKLDTDEFWQSRMPDWSKVKVPLLSSANWGGQGLHPRGNFEGFVRAASKQKWLEVHGLEHWSEFYTDYGVDLQKRFFGHFLKGEATGWEKQPNVFLQVRHPGEQFVARAETSWPLENTQWTKFYLDPADLSLRAEAGPEQSSSITYAGTGRRCDLPVATDAGVHRDHGADRGQALGLVGNRGRGPVPGGAAVQPRHEGSRVPRAHWTRTRRIAQGWLRVSHRKLDETLTLPYRPYHTHDEVQKLTPDEVYEVDVEVWPTCIVVPPGHRLALTVRGKDYVYGGDVAPSEHKTAKPWTGVALFRHDDPADRPVSVFGGDVTLHAGPGMQPFLLLPVIPQQ